MGSNNVLVFAERRYGDVKRPTLETLGVARKAADAMGGRVDVLALGPGAGAAASLVGRYGADRLLVAEAEHLELYAPEAYAATLAEAANAAEAAVVLLPATIMGKDLAPRSAARLETGLLSDVVELEVGPDGAVRGKRAVYSGKALAWASIPKARPAVATLRPNVFPLCEVEGTKEAEVVPVDPALAPDQLRVRTVKVEQAGTQELDVTEASVIVSGGRGLKDPENFKLIRELAHALGGAVGASRAVVDAGWIAHAHQVGQTGKVVSPNLYIACGISGAIQHLAGMSSSKVIVAVNKDREAPIFKLADYGIVGDLFDVVPKLTDQIKKLQADG